MTVRAATPKGKSARLRQAGACRGRSWASALARCQKAAWYTEEPFTGQNKLPEGSAPQDFVDMVDKVADLCSYGPKPVQIPVGISVYTDEGLVCRGGVSSESVCVVLHVRVLGSLVYTTQ